jgi:hypothetical protein
VSPVKYKLGFYIPEDDILHSHSRENLKSYIEKKVACDGEVRRRNEGFAELNFYTIQQFPKNHGIAVGIDGDHKLDNTGGGFRYPVESSG